MTQKTKKLICRIFGHKWERNALGDIVTYEIVEYKKLNNGFPNRLNGKTKRRKKRKIVTLWKRCERCGTIKKRYQKRPKE